LTLGNDERADPGILVLSKWRGYNPKRIEKSKWIILENIRPGGTGTTK